MWPKLPAIDKQIKGATSPAADLSAIAHIVAIPPYNDMLNLYVAEMTSNGSVSIVLRNGITASGNFVVGSKWLRRQSDGPGVVPVLRMLTSPIFRQEPGEVLTLSLTEAVHGGSIQTKGWIPDVLPLLNLAAHPMDESGQYWLMLVASRAPQHDDDDQGSITGTGIVVIRIDASGQDISVVFASKTSDPSSWF